MEDMARIAGGRMERALAFVDDPALRDMGEEIGFSGSDPDRWAPATVRFADQALEGFPPGPGNGEARLALAELMDVAVHLEFTEALEEEIDRMYARRLSRAIGEIQSAEVSHGLRIWKIYNMGFVVKSKNHAVAFDLHPGKVAGPLSGEQIGVIADVCDALFVTHRHGDHWTAGVLDAFARRGKPVVLPEDDFWSGDTAVLAGDHIREPLDVAGLKLWSYRGQQLGRCPCNVYIVEMDGIKVSHNGDMNTPYPWVHAIHLEHDIDVQLLNCWALPTIMARGQKARMIVTGHEWELGHDIDGRRGYDETQAMLKPGFKRTFLVWGESATYVP